MSERVARGWYLVMAGLFVVGLVIGYLFVPPWFGMGPGSVPSPSPSGAPAEAHDDDMSPSPPFGGDVPDVERWREQARENAG